MKPRMMSKPNMDHLFHHILGGHESSHRSIEIARERGLISDQEMTDLLKKNSDRLIERIKDFKIINKLLCLVFACLFGFAQISGEDLELRRTSARIRIQSRSSRRRE
jgi:hypothetical protein